MWFTILQSFITGMVDRTNALLWLMIITDQWLCTSPGEKHQGSGGEKNHKTLVNFIFPFMGQSRWTVLLTPQQSCYHRDLFWQPCKRLVLQESEWTWLARQHFNGIVREATINQLLWLNGRSSKSCMSTDQ